MSKTYRECIHDVNEMMRTGQSLQDRDVGGEIILNSNQHFYVLKWCVVLA